MLALSPLRDSHHYTRALVASPASW